MNISEEEIEQTANGIIRIVIETCEHNCITYTPAVGQEVVSILSQIMDLLGSFDDTMVEAVIIHNREKLLAIAEGQKND